MRLERGWAAGCQGHGISDVQKTASVEKKKQPACCLPRSWTLPRFPRAFTERALLAESASTEFPDGFGRVAGSCQKLGLHRQSLQESRARLLPPKPCSPQPGTQGGAPTPSWAEPHEVGILDCPPGHLPSSPSPTPPIPVSRPWNPAPFVRPGWSSCSPLH